MFTGSLIDDLIATVQKAEKSATSRPPQGADVGSPAETQLNPTQDPKGTSEAE